MSTKQTWRRGDRFLSKDQMIAERDKSPKDVATEEEAAAKQQEDEVAKVKEEEAAKVKEEEATKVKEEEAAKAKAADEKEVVTPNAGNKKGFMANLIGNKKE